MTNAAQVLECAGQDGELQARISELCGPEDFLDYDPLPYELALRDSYAKRGFLFGGGSERAKDDFDAFEARLKLSCNFSSTENGNATVEHD